jgi:hypothetical protein
MARELTVDMNIGYAKLSITEEILLLPTEPTSSARINPRTVLGFVTLVS